MRYPSIVVHSTAVMPRPNCAAWSLRGAGGLAWLPLAVALASCAPSATEGGFNNPAPGARAYAIEDAVKFDRRDQIPQIVECLLSDDELLRFMAIGALYRMTGQDLGYRFDDPEPLRLASCALWRQWTIDQKLAPPENTYTSTIYPPARDRPSW